jgi:NADPH:quinone reductase-like Zn-dependent oxidoreductase
VLAARAVRALEPGSDDPLSALEVADAPAAEVPPGWVRVTVAAAALNRHDLWSLRGVGERRHQVVDGGDHSWE